MKQFFLFVLCLAGILESHAQNTFTVKAKISNPKHLTALLGYFTNGKFLSDTNYTVENGWYVFKGSVAEPLVATFGFRNNPALTIKAERGFIPGPALPFVLSNEQITIKGDANRVYASSVEGGTGNKEWKQIRKKENEISAELWSLERKYYEGGEDSASRRHTSDSMTTLARRKFQIQKDFVDRNPHSIVSAYFLSNMVNSLPIDELKTAFDKLDENVKTTSYGQRIAKKIEGMDATAVGKAAVPISKKDINGKLVNLETLKGKYVLIDFWGSWCHPCRMSHPHLKELYSKYKSQGLEILGIAQENGQTPEASRKAWVDAVDKDGITWLQVLNNEDVDKFDAVKAYGVSAFPTKILLDKEGKILARYVGFGGDELDKKLRELFNN